MFELKIEGLSHDGRGVGRHEGKAVFVAQAVPGDTVSVRLSAQQKNFDEATLVKLETASEDRSIPFCALYGECGGCQLQHLSLAAQRYWKASNFFTALKKTVNMKKCEILPPLTGEGEAYRRRARLVLGKNKSDKEPRLGFRALGSNDIIDVPFCPVLRPALNAALADAREKLLPSASRNPKEITLVEANDGVVWSGLPDSEAAQSLASTTVVCEYDLQGLKLQFPPDGFIQVNPSINTLMVQQAMDWLGLEKHHKVLDLFCGVGNFTLPLAKTAAQVIGIEGDLDLVNMAKQNAIRNQLENVTFHKANLFEDQTPALWFKKQKYDAILLDPGRAGAAEICLNLATLSAQRIVYVSCNAATLIRDVQTLEKQGYQLQKANMIDMFPQTNHTEVMVLLVKTAKKATKKGPGVFKL